MRVIKSENGRQLASTNLRKQAQGVSGMERIEHLQERSEVQWRQARWAVSIDFEPLLKGSLEGPIYLIPRDIVQQIPALS
jgi:hypothetical protein